MNKLNRLQARLVAVSFTLALIIPNINFAEYGESSYNSDFGQLQELEQALAVGQGGAGVGKDSLKEISSQDPFVAFETKLEEISARNQHNEEIQKKINDLRAKHRNWDKKTAGKQNLMNQLAATQSGILENQAKLDRNAKQQVQQMGRSRTQDPTDQMQTEAEDSRCTKGTNFPEMKQMIKDLSGSSGPIAEMKGLLDQIVTKKEKADKEELAKNAMKLYEAYKKNDELEEEKKDIDSKIDQAKSIEEQALLLEQSLPEKVKTFKDVKDALGFKLFIDFPKFLAKFNGNDEEFNKAKGGFSDLLGGIADAIKVIAPKSVKKLFTNCQNLASNQLGADNVQTAGSAHAELIAATREFYKKSGPNAVVEHNGQKMKPEDYITQVYIPEQQRKATPFASKCVEGSESQVTAGITAPLDTMLSAIDTSTSPETLARNVNVSLDNFKTALTSVVTSVNDSISACDEVGKEEKAVRKAAQAKKAEAPAQPADNSFAGTSRGSFGRRGTGSRTGTVHSAPF